LSILNFYRIIYLDYFFEISVNKAKKMRVSGGFPTLPTIRSKNYWDNRQPHKFPPHPQFNVVWMTEKRKFNPLFPTLIMRAGGRPTYFKMAKNVKSLIIFARDCLRWSCLGVSCPKFEILPISSDQVDMKLTYFNQLTESFLSPKI
jgi:hypothetical protein